MSSASDEELDFCSPKFNATKALYSKDVKPPKENAPIMDNLSKFELTPEGKLTIKGLQIKREQEPESDIKLSGPSTSAKVKEVKSETTDTTDKDSETKEDFFVKRKKKKLRNVLTRMDDMAGPLSVLRECMELRRRVKIVTRRESSIRGFCEGFVEAFDKHWNIALRDVHEVWLKIKHRRASAPMLPIGERIENKDAEFTREMHGIKVPRVFMLDPKNRNSRAGTFERHVDQMFIRGEHVVLITIM